MKLDSVFEMLEDIASVSGASSKKERLKLIAQSEEGVRFLRLAFDDTKYNISTQTFHKLTNDKHVNEVFESPDEFVSSYARGEVESSMDSVAHLIGLVTANSGHALHSILRYELFKFDEKTVKWITRVLMKDLRIGLQIKSVNDVLKSVGLPEIEKFAVQLCGKIADVENFNEIEKKVGFPCHVAIKYDGMRAIIEKRGDMISITSRQGKEIEYVPELVDAMKNLEDDFVLDGEILCDDFSTLQKRIGRKEIDEHEESLRYVVYDVLEFNEHDYLKDEGQLSRVTFMNNEMQHLFDEKRLVRETYIHCDKHETIIKFYDSACKNGEEGIIIKNLFAKYEYNARKNWFKVKPKFENTFKVIGCDKGKGKNASKISVLIVESEDGVTSRVGSGLTDSLRDFVTNLHENNGLLGTYVDVEYNEISRNSKGGTSLRFPRFLKFRDDKDCADSLLSN